MERNKRIRKEKYKDKGITLIALVVTIIILIILATISVNMVFSENGLIATAKEAREHQANATVSEKAELDKGAQEAANIIAGGSEGSTSIPAGTEVNKPEATTPEDKWSEKVTAISDGSGNAIPLPDGFYYVGGNRTEGLVISDNEADKNKGTSYETASTLKGNQYVWIPVDNEETLTRTQFDTTTGLPTEGLVITGFIAHKEPYGGGYSDGKGTQETVDFDTMKTQVLKYKGFYIGRYEAGDGDIETTMRTKVTTDHKIVCKKGIVPYNYIPWGKSASDIESTFAPNVNNSDKVETHGAVYLSKHMYDGKEQAESTVSTLCYGSQWDAMCRYIGDNYRTTSKKESLELTGSVKEDISKNIYDLAGNCAEWTMEQLLGKVDRGGSYDRVYEIGKRMDAPEYNCFENLGFRLSLYIK